MRAARSWPAGPISVSRCDRIPTNVLQLNKIQIRAAGSRTNRALGAEGTSPDSVPAVSGGAGGRSWGGRCEMCWHPPRGTRLKSATSRSHPVHGRRPSTAASRHCIGPLTPANPSQHSTTRPRLTTQLAPSHTTPPRPGRRHLPRCAASALAPRDSGKLDE